MGELKFIGKRVVYLAVMLFGVATLVFILTKMIPGDPVVANLSQRALNDPEIVAAYRAKHGLDRPLIVQYIYYIRDLLHFDLGTSIRTSRPVLEEVIGDLDLNISYEILKSKISINNPADTRILAITATDPDPQMAKAIVDRTASVSSGYIGDIMEMIPPKIIEEGQVPTQKSSPSNTRNAALGALLGLVLTCGITAMQMILNDTIQTEEDVERYLDLTVLASVPRRNEDGKGAEAERKSKKKKARTAPRENQESQKPEGRSRRKGGKE